MDEVKKDVKETAGEVKEAVEDTKAEVEETAEEAKKAADGTKEKSIDIIEGLKKDILGEDGKFDDTDVQRIAANAAKNIEDAIAEAKAAFALKEGKKD